MHRSDHESMFQGLPPLPSPVTTGSLDEAVADSTVPPAGAPSPASGAGLGARPVRSALDSGGANRPSSGPTVVPAGGPTPTPARPPARPLRPGCYLLRWTPSPETTFPDGSTFHYDGTLRVEARRGDPIISGDLYVHPWSPWQVEIPDPTLPAPDPVPHGEVSHGDLSPDDGQPTNGEGSPPPIDTRLEPNPSAGIPIFPIENYRHYLRGVRIVPTTEPQTRLVLILDFHRWRIEDSTWHSEGLFTADLRWKIAPIGFPGTADYLEGVLRDRGGAPVGAISLGWVSKHLRKAVLEVDGVAEAEAPEHNGAGIDWRAAFAEVDWDLEVVDSHRTVPEPNQTGAWSNTDLHREMLRWRDNADHNSSWRFHLFCVRRLTATDRGIMYDAFAGDSNNIPREGAAIASHWIVPDIAKWGHARGRRVGGYAPIYFRTAVHEIGHAMGLFHNSTDNGFMNTTDVIAASASSAAPFPDNVMWSFAPDDAHRLRHMPDIRVRPGGTPFGQTYSSAPIVAEDRLGEAPGMVLGVASMLATVPLGAPARIDLEMVNTCDVPRPGPSTLSMKAGHVSGRVIDPSGTVRSFRPLVLCLEEVPGSREFQPGEKMTHSMTLLRGGQGALFPIPGQHRVEVDVAWEVDGFEVKTSGASNVMVTPPENEDHAQAAKRILNTPDALLSLVLGGDYLHAGIAAIQIGASDKVLGPHYAIIEAKRLAKDPEADLDDLKAAMELLDERAVVLSGSELKRAAELVAKAIATRGTIGKGRAVAQRVKDRVDTVSVSPTVKAIVKEL